MQTGDWKCLDTLYFCVDRDDKHFLEEVQQRQGQKTETGWANKEKSYIVYFDGLNSFWPFSTFFVNFKRFSVIFQLKSRKNVYLHLSKYMSGKVQLCVWGIICYALSYVFIPKRLLVHRSERKPLNFKLFLFLGIHKGEVCYSNLVFKPYRRKWQGGDIHWFRSLVLYFLS